MVFGSSELGACLWGTAVSQPGGPHSGGVGVQGPKAGDKDRHRLLPPSCCQTRMSAPSVPRKPLSPLCPSTHRVKEVYRLEEMEKIFVR